MSRRPERFVMLTFWFDDSNADRAVSSTCGRRHEVASPVRTEEVYPSGSQVKPLLCVDGLSCAQRLSCVYD